MLFIDLWKKVVIWVVVALGLVLALPNAFYDRVEQFNDAEKAIEVGFDTPENREKTGLWLSFLPSGLVNLGLDLRGGAHLLAEVQVADVYAQRMTALWPDVRDVLRPERATVGTIRLQKGAPDELRVKISEPAGMDRALQLVRGLSQPVTSLGGAMSNDLDVRAEGDEIVVMLSAAEQAATTERTLRQALEIIRRRIDEVGTREPTIQRQGADRILIQVPGIGSAAELKEIIGTTAQLTFQPVVGRGGNPDVPAGAGNELLPSLNDEGVYYTLVSAPVVTGEELVDAHDALADIEATLSIFEHQLEQHQSLNVPLAKLTELYNNTDVQMVDFGRKIYKKEGAYYWNFGKHRHQLISETQDYARWVLDKDFAMNTKMHLRKILATFEA